ncbi:MULTISPECIES: hypothetical protein [unclassified Dysgonomonas]|uniref:hypothetical protein n=1 Tax=unclassified Dysgonomonas TaxID=2630389 RepID=UPI0025BC00F5|nr:MULTISPECIES: hypothetical protein [unclassified Dysgonomonas]HMM02026.1 hypothetical protein [Dysgonomonas sp.]
MTHFEILSKLDPAIISHFLETGQSEGIPPETQQWLQEISMAYEEYDKNRNISKAAESLKVRITAKFRNKISVRTCQERIYSALEYFHVDNIVSDKVWYIDFANKYEEDAEKAIQAEDFRAAYMFRKAAEECREKSSVAASLDVKFIPVFLISSDISIIDAGFEPKNLKEIAKKDNEGYYVRQINSLPIDEPEKKRLRIDANLPETPCIELESD